MDWTPTATRGDVVRLVARYVRLEFSIRSATGKLVVDESRVAKKRTTSKVDLEDLSGTELLDMMRTSLIRQAVYAKPDDPALDLQVNEYGYRPRRVIPLRDAVQTVRVRTTRGSGDENNARDWRATVAQKLAEIPSAQRAMLLGAEELRQRMRETHNRREDIERTVRRVKSSGKVTRQLRSGAEATARTLRSSENADTDLLRRVVRSRAYREGIDNLLAVCTETPEIEAYIFEARK